MAVACFSDEAKLDGSDDDEEEVEDVNVDDNVIVAVAWFSDEAKLEGSGDDEDVADSNVDEISRPSLDYLTKKLADNVIIYDSFHLIQINQ